MGKYLKDELITQRLTPMLIKFFLSGIATYYFTKDASEFEINKIGIGIFMFLTIYMLCSIFHINIKITQNYLIGSITGLISVLGLCFGLVSVEESIGKGFAVIAPFFLLLIFLVYDIYKLIKVMKIDVE